MSLHTLTIHELQEMLAEGQVSAVEITKDVLGRVEKVGGPLCGIPLSIKDVLCTDSLRTTCGSRILENFIPPYDATSVVKLKQADAVLIGKVAMDEFWQWMNLPWDQPQRIVPLALLKTPGIRIISAVAPAVALPLRWQLMNV
jgi:Asp-tRNA(Asn)/Glu-tRNA(Gln) amidotransferase A subunit family amidase